MGEYGVEFHAVSFGPPMNPFALMLLLVALLAAALGAGIALWWRGRHPYSLPGTADLLLDPHTGLHSQAATLAALARTLSLADRLQHPVTVVIVQIDGYADLLAQAPGPTQALERVLADQMAQRVRTYDVLGQWAPGQFLAVLPDADVASALVLAEDLRELARRLETPGGVSISLGLHGRQPTPTQPLHDLTADMVVAAQRALEATSANGPGRIEIEP